MKRTNDFLLRTTKALVAIAFALSMLNGCSDNPAIRSRYEAEKLIYQAQKALEGASVRPELVTDQTRDEVTSLFQKAVDYSLTALKEIDPETYPTEFRELQFLAFRATSRLAQLTYERHQFDKSLAVLERLLETTSLPPTPHMATMINLGRALQASQQWDSAQVIYQQTLEANYPPVDADGEIMASLFNLPLHMLKVAGLTGDSAMIEKKFSEAEEYYKSLAGGQFGNQLAGTARSQLSYLYEITKSYDKAIAELESISNPTAKSYIPIQLKIADLYADKLGKYEKSLSIYQDLLPRTNSSDTILYPQIQFRIALVKMELGELNEARQMLLDLKTDYRRYFFANPRAQWAIARSFEMQGKWNRAEIEFRFLIENFGESDEALMSFAYIADRLTEMGRTTEAQRWLNDGIEHYNSLASTSPGTLTEAKALAFHAGLLQHEKKWKEAAEMYSLLFTKFPSTEPGQKAMAKAARIYAVNLKDTATSDSLLQVLRASLTNLEQTR